MIIAVGRSNVTLKRIASSVGFGHLGQGGDIAGILNCGYPPAGMREYVYVRYSQLRDVPTINKSLITDKLQAIKKVSDVGLAEHVPPSTSNVPTHGEVESTWIVKPYASQCGAGIRRWNGGGVPFGCYLQKDVGKFREFRAHVGLWLDDPVFTIQEKKPKPELWESAITNRAETSGMPYDWPTSADLRQFLPVTWNIDSGFYFRRTTTPENREEKIRRFPLLKRIEDLAIKAVKALGYQYGAVDILMNDDRHLYVVEINSHPAIKNDTSVEIYQYALRELAGKSRTELSQICGGGTTRVTFVQGQGIL